ncbi:TIGR02594 family protein [Moraxella sp. VT-16-12]|uniref:TIGR02594 family protein n=1 Tax=Moraxella sp. VT-16-12 TaxID=2014877 RepID=UPI000B7E6D64|nr:TIGR02594 family protein [Moraxella sp. VT-16-12]TWV79904.1 TIGR02594 family protein [Moraxella sp. VT-16-12]
MKQTKLPWIEKAKEYIGTAEKVGKAENPVIVKMWEQTFIATNQEEKLKQAVWRTENTPWCGGFVGFILSSVGLTKHIPQAFPLARAWASAGTRLEKPAYGCVVVFSRNGGGHVGFVVGKDKFGNLMVLGGNQGDAVNIKPFAKSRVLAYRWCGTQSHPAPHRYELPVLGSDGRVSRDEA